MLTSNRKVQLVEIADQIQHLHHIQSLVELSIDAVHDYQLTEDERLDRIDLLLTCYQERLRQSLATMTEAITQARKKDQ